MTVPSRTEQPVGGHISVQGSGALPHSTGAPAPLPSGTLPQYSAPSSEAVPQQQEQQEKRLGPFQRLKKAVKKLKREVLALHYAQQDSRLGLLPRLLAFFAVAYALSPLDLIPDFIPVLGIVDDVIILGALLGVAIWLIPKDVMQHARERAEHEPLRLHKNWGMALLFFATWDATLLALAWWGCRAAAARHPAFAPYQVWVLVGLGVVAVAAELAWAVAQWRREQRMSAVMAAVGMQPELQEALLQGGTQSVQAYLEP